MKMKEISALISQRRRAEKAYKYNFQTDEAWGHQESSAKEQFRPWSKTSVKNQMQN